MENPWGNPMLQGFFFCILQSHSKGSATTHFFSRWSFPFLRVKVFNQAIQFIENHSDAACRAIYVGDAEIL